MQYSMFPYVGIYYSSIVRLVLRVIGFFGFFSAIANTCHDFSVKISQRVYCRKSFVVPTAQNQRNMPPKHREANS